MKGRQKYGIRENNNNKNNNKVMKICRVDIFALFSGKNVYFIFRVFSPKPEALEII
jgi:hypothetical protein